MMAFRLVGAKSLFEPMLEPKWPALILHVCVG